MVFNDNEVLHEEDKPANSANQDDEEDGLMSLFTSVKFGISPEEILGIKHANIGYWYK